MARKLIYEFRREWKSISRPSKSTFFNSAAFKSSRTSSAVLILYFTFGKTFLSSVILPCSLYFAKSPATCGGNGCLAVFLFLVLVPGRITQDWLSSSFRCSHFKATISFLRRPVAPTRAYSKHRSTAGIPSRSIFLLNVSAISFWNCSGSNIPRCFGSAFSFDICLNGFIDNLPFLTDQLQKHLIAVKKWLRVPADDPSSSRIRARCLITAEGAMSLRYENRHPLNIALQRLIVFWTCIWLLPLAFSSASYSPRCSFNSLVWPIL